jgi:hypothetical protein
MRGPALGHLGQLDLACVLAEGQLDLACALPAGQLELAYDPISSPEAR